MNKYILTVISMFQGIFLLAQTPVRNEPRHHNVFENDFVRILDVHLGPDDTTEYHLHNTPSVFIVLTKTKVGSQLYGKQPEPGVSLKSEISYDSLVTPRLHHVWNNDTSWFHVMDVELTSTKHFNIIPPLQNHSFKLLFNEQQVNGYKMEFPSGRQLQIPASANGYLLVSLGESVIDYKINNAIQRRIMKAGHYIWIEAGKTSSITMSSGSNAGFTLLQFK